MVTLLWTDALPSALVTCAAHRGPAFCPCTTKMLTVAKPAPPADRAPLEHRGGPEAYPPVK